MTLAKTSKARTRRRLKIPKASWAALADAPAAEGAQTLGTIELMAMAGDDGNGGYPVVATRRRRRGRASSRAVRRRHRGAACISESQQTRAVEAERAGSPRRCLGDPKVNSAV